MDNNLMPARAVPPGRILRRELQARGWTQEELADILGCSAQTITEIVRGTTQITPETAVALGTAFGTSPRVLVEPRSQPRFHDSDADPRGSVERARSPRQVMRGAARLLVPAELL